MARGSITTTYRGKLMMVIGNMENDMEGEFINIH